MVSGKNESNKGFFSHAQSIRDLVEHSTGAAPFFSFLYIICFCFSFVRWRRVHVAVQYLGRRQQGKYAAYENNV